MVLVFVFVFEFDFVFVCVLVFVVVLVVGSILGLFITVILVETPPCRLWERAGDDVCGGGGGNGDDFCELVVWSSSSSLISSLTLFAVFGMLILVLVCAFLFLTFVELAFVVFVAVVFVFMAVVAVVFAVFVLFVFESAQFVRSGLWLLCAMIRLRNDACFFILASRTSSNTRQLHSRIINYVNNVSVVSV